jgi:hypothetical protein
MELDHLEMTTSNYILKLKIRDVSKFRNIVGEMTSKIKNIRMNMKTILFKDTPWRSKSGLILEQKNFSNSNVLPTNTYIVLTDINSRLQSSPIKLLNDLSHLSDSALSKYLNFIAEERSFFTQAFSEPATDGSYAPTGYGTYGVSFPGGSSFLDLLHKNKKSILLVSSPLESKLKCFTKVRNISTEIDCLRIF